MKRAFVLAVFVCGLLLISPSMYVHACSGGAPTPLATLLEGAEVVIKARVLDTDTYGQTGVVEVLETLVGQADADRLLVVQSEPIRSIYFIENRGGSGGCATLALPFTLEEEVYLFLESNEDGTYRLSYNVDMVSYGTLAYRFPNPNSTAQLVLGAYGTETTPSTIEYVQVTEPEFRQYVTEYAEDAAPRPPARTGVAYPASAPILISTTTGAVYTLPPDHTAPVPVDAETLAQMRRAPSVWRRGNPLGVTGCNQMGCTAFSPNGLDRATVTPDGVEISGFSVDGSGFLFSSTNEMIAVWNEGALDLYTLRYPRYDLIEFWNTFHSTRPLNDGNAWIAQAAWTHDGRLLAYTDRDGLWLLDVYSQFTRLVLPNETGTPAIARYFSEGGRYLAITQGAQNSNLDLITGELHPDGVFSPDERFLLAYDTSAPRSTFSLCNVTSPYPCRTYGFGLGLDGTWTYNDSNLYPLFNYLHCDSEDALTCHHISRSPWCCAMGYYGDAILYDYERTTQSYLFLRSGMALEIFDGYHWIQRDLSQWLDDDIAAVEWLPAFYLGERTFSDTVIEQYQQELQSSPPM